MKKIFFAVLTASLLASCAVETHINFKPDNSGDYKMKLDMSMATSMLDDSLSEDGAMSIDEFKQVEDQLKAVPGITNVLLTSPSTGVYEIAYNFDGLASLTTSSSEQLKGEEDFSSMKFASKGKRMTIDMSPSEDMKQSREDIESMTAMGEMLTYTIEMHFERKIASVKSSVAELNKENNSLLFNIALSEMVDDKKNWVTKVKFK
ncbi:MAG: hypothetical protein SH856_06925 [Flavobacteriales bacterium]|nr:hypothetical protein [Flavobacteriales bacterium]